MTRRRWWDLAFAGTAIGIAVLVALDGWPPDARETGAIISMGALVALYYTFGRYAIGEDSPRWRRMSWAIIMIILLGVGISFDPVVSFIQAVIYPSLWIITRSVKSAIVLNLLGGLAVALGYVIYMGTDAAVLGLVVGGLSVSFSLALGLWINNIAEYGDERARLLNELTEAQGELAAMHRDAGVTSERERLAREIHDTIAQSLTAQVMLAQRGRLENENGAGRAALDDTLELLETGARAALDEARALVAAMAPERVGDGSLAETISRLAARFERETGVQIDATVDPAVTAAGLNRELEVVLLRCTQEGLANVRKHAQASAATVSMAVSDAASDAAVLLTVSDNGRGLGDAGELHSTGTGAAPGVANSGFGVNGMRERVGLVGGTLELVNGALGGAELRVRVPLPIVDAIVTAAARSAGAAAATAAATAAASTAAATSATTATSTPPAQPRILNPMLTPGERTAP